MLKKLAVFLMIRRAGAADLEQVMAIWLATNCEAHPFIDALYWQNHFDKVQRTIRQSTVFVAEREGQILGFVGLVDHMIAGLFVAKKYQHMGIGKQLLATLKATAASLELSVYQKNTAAIDFYESQGFKKIALHLEQENSEKEYTMRWQKERGS
jgi:ribosomal protein S18 acetylase RimI-like enzyme